MSFPHDLRYTKEHEWLRAEGRTWRVGITQFAVNQLGDIVVVDLPRNGATLPHGESFGTIESVKSVSELYMPVSGKIVTVNPELNTSPELVNEDPYGEGWMIEIEPSNTSEIDGLMTAEQYDEFIKSA